LNGDQRRLLIQREAGRLFARSGYAATTLDDIAAAAGVTKPMVYRHFASKKALYLALLAKHENDLPTFFERIDADSLDGTPQTLLHAILDVWFDYVWENQHAWVMLFRDSSGDADIQQFRRTVSASARRVLAEFIAAQPGSAIPPAQVQPTAELLRSGLAGLALWWIDNPGTPKPQGLDVALRMSLPAILPA
jgi:AcrR family transcriptional regulator